MAMLVLMISEAAAVFCTRVLGQPIGIEGKSRGGGEDQIGFRDCFGWLASSGLIGVG